MSDDILKKNEYSYECIVVEQIIYNKLTVWAIKEDNILMLCPEYVHFNKKNNK